MAHLNSLKSVIAIAACCSLVACGGGGGSSTPTAANSSQPVTVSSSVASSVASSTPADTTPDAFSFTAITDAAVNTAVTSGSATIAGINQATAITIVGGEYAIDSGAFTNSSGTVTSGQTIKVRLTSSANTNTATTATLTVGGVSAAFSVTTLVSSQPNAFSFTPATDVALNSVNTSGSITVTGIDVAVPISITGGEYAIDSGSFTSTAGTVNKNQTVKVRGTAAATTSTTSNVVLTIGGTGKTVSGTYVITTLADTTAPTATVLFPPPASQTDGNTILVRGTASDDYNTITSLKVNGVDATTTDGYATWQALVPLSYTTLPVVGTTNNTVTISTEDSEGNANESAASFAIRQAPTNTPFPDANYQLDQGQNLVLDNFGGRNRLLVTAFTINPTTSKVVAIDLATGSRTAYAPPISTDKKDAVVTNPYAAFINPSNQRYYIGTSGSNNNHAILEFDLNDSTSTTVLSYYTPTEYLRESYGATLNTNTGSFVWLSVPDGGTERNVVESNSDLSISKILSDSTHPDAINPLHKFDQGIAFDAKYNRYLVPDMGLQALIAIDPTTGARTIVSSNSVGSGDAFSPADPVDTKYGTGAISAINLNIQNNQAYVYETAGNCEKVGRLKSCNAIEPGKIFSIDLSNGNRKVISDKTIDEFNQNSSFFASVMAANNAYMYSVGNDLENNSKIFATDVVTGKRVVISN